MALNLKRLVGGKEDEQKSLLKRMARLERQQRAIVRLLQQQHLAADAALFAPSFRVHGHGIHSKAGEDGLILHILRQIGAKRKTFFEIGIQDGLECNTANLAFNFGWSGVLLEGDEAYARAAEKNYAMLPDVRVRQAFVNRENINGLMTECGVDRECDVFSLDIDGNDYWIWEALNPFRPRIVIVEYNSTFGPERSVSVPYDPTFVYRSEYPRGYFGASLEAFARLASRKEYALVGTSDFGSNAFFVRRDELTVGLPEVTVAAAYRPKYRTWKKPFDPKKVKGLELVEIQ